MQNLFEKLDRALGGTERYLMIVLTAALTAILCAQVVLRYFFNSPLFWAEEVAVQLLIIITFVGVSYLTFMGKLVRVDFLLLAFSGTKRVWLGRVLDVVSLITLMLLCYVATDWITRPEVRGDVSATTQIPRWYNYSVLVFSFYCMTYHQFVKVLVPEVLEDHQPSASEVSKVGAK